MAFYDIDAILMEEEKVPCVSQVDVVKLGFLDPAGAGEHLKAGRLLELPLWIVNELTSKMPNAVELRPPKQLTDAYLETLDADPKVVDLHSWCPYFFDFGMAFSRLQPESTIAESLSKAFAERYQVISDLSQNSVKDDNSDKTRKLDNLERKLFALGFKSDQQFQHWLTRRAHLIAVAPGADRPAAKRAKMVNTG